MIILTGTYPPEKCGVGDYTHRLLQTPVAKEQNWQLYYAKDTSLRAFLSIRKDIKRMGDTSINIQYPSIGFAKSLLPHVLCIYYRLFSNVRVSVTIHEYTQLGWKGALSAYALLIFARQFIFTNEFERNAAIKRWGRMRKKSTIIKIYTNINAVDKPKQITDRKYDVGYFGYIRPEKGLEDYVQVLGDLKKQDPSLKAYIMGQTQPLYQAYSDAILKQATDNGIELIVNQENTTVTDILSETKIAYLPFPDGISERRGSALACIKNLSLIVTTTGIFATQAHKDMLELVTVDVAADTIRRLLSLPKENLDAKQQKVRQFIETEMPKSWDDVAQQYKQFLL